MVILRKIEGTTLMETLVATVLIIIVFMMASLILNNLFSSSLKGNNRSIDSYLREVEYLERNQKLNIPAQLEYRDWHVNIVKEETGPQTIVVMEAYNIKTKMNYKRVYVPLEK